MRIFARAAFAFIAWVTVYLFSYWAIFAQFLPDGIDIAAAFLSATCVAACFWRASIKIGTAGLTAHIFLGAVITGSTAFAAGFFGPMIFTPEANQGPLLGLLITGPLGFIGGGFLGAIWWFLHRTEKTDKK